MMFATVPREIIYNKDFGIVRVGTYIYLFKNRITNGIEVVFSIEDIVNWMKQKPNRNSGKINDQCIDMIYNLVDLKYITSIAAKDDLRGKFVKLNRANTDPYMFDLSADCANISYEEIKKIQNYESALLKNGNSDISGLSVNILLLILAYIRVNIDGNKAGPNCCYRHLSAIKEDIGLSQKTIAKAIPVLEELKLIRCREIKRRRYIGLDGQYHFKTTPKIFANEYKYKRDSDGELVIDTNYDPEKEIQMQEKDLLAKWLEKENNYEQQPDIDYE